MPYVPLATPTEAVSSFWATDTTGVITLSTYDAFSLFQFPSVADYRITFGNPNYFWVTDTPGAISLNELFENHSYATTVVNIIAPEMARYSMMAFDTGLQLLVQWQSIGYIEMSPQATTPQFTGTLLGARLIGKGF